MKMDADGTSTYQHSLSADDMEALDFFQTSTHRLLNRHYEVGMLWKPDRHLTNNQLFDNKQLDSFPKRLKRNPTIEDGRRLDGSHETGNHRHGSSGRKIVFDSYPITNVNNPGKALQVLNASSNFNGDSQQYPSNWTKAPKKPHRNRHETS